MSVPHSARTLTKRSEANFRRVMTYSAHVSVNTAVADLDRTEALLRHVPRHRILLASDGPFINPDGVPAAPMALGRVILRLAGRWGVEVEARQAQFRSNARRLLE